MVDVLHLLANFSHLRFLTANIDKDEQRLYELL